jgi:hypothetical protein
VSNQDDTPGQEGEPAPDEGVLLPLEVTPGQGLELPGLAPTPTREWEEGQHLAESRRFIAYWLLGILSGVLILSWTAVLTGWANFQDIQALMTIVFAPIIGLVGAATGFYFGERVGSAGPGQGKPPPPGKK